MISETAMQEFQHLYFDLKSPLADTKRALLTWGCFVLRNAVNSHVLPQLYETTRRLFEEDLTDYGRDLSSENAEYVTDASWPELL